MDEATDRFDYFFKGPWPDGLPVVIPAADLGISRREARTQHDGNPRLEQVQLDDRHPLPDGTGI
jgi:hypothetical protein